MITVEIKKVGIMGGTFNPIHQGHLLLAEEARCFCQLDKILFMPSGYSYMKNEKEIAENQIRLDMTRLAIEDNDYFELSTLEMERKGATYTYETLSVLQSMHPENEYYFILGADNLFSIEKWKHPEVIFRNCKLVAAIRGEKDTNAIHKKAEELSLQYDANIILLPARCVDISSTEIRQRLCDGRSIRYLVPEKVYSYIHDNRLYQDNETTVR